jgi:hypothetical protein
MVDRSAGQRRQRLARCGDLDVAVMIGIFDDRIRIGDIEVVADQRDAEGRTKVVEEEALLIRYTVTIGVVQ